MNTEFDWGKQQEGKEPQIMTIIIFCVELVQMDVQFLYVAIRLNQSLTNLDRANQGALFSLSNLTSVVASEFVARIKSNLSSGMSSWLASNPNLSCSIRVHG